MYNVISGMRRSGTSMLMYALKKAKVSVIGDDYSNNPSRIERDGNPNGYWETDKVTTDTGITEFIGDGDLVKVMTECLYKSNPNFIDNVVMIFRDPASVIASTLKNNKIDDLEMFTINHLMDVVDSLEFCKHFKIPVKIVIYEDILDNPLEQMTAICEFIGNGKPRRAARAVKLKLNRSSGEQLRELRKMNKVYEMALNEDIDGIIKYKDNLKKRAKKLIKQYDRRNN